MPIRIFTRESVYIDGERVGSPDKIGTTSVVMAELPVNDKATRGVRIDTTGSKSAVTHAASSEASDEKDVVKKVCEAFFFVAICGFFLPCTFPTT